MNQRVYPGYIFASMVILSLAVVPITPIRGAAAIETVLAPFERSNSLHLNPSGSSFLSGHHPTTGWHTFYGSIDFDEGFSLTLDEDGNIYIVGYSESDWKVEGGPEPLHPYSGGDEVVIIKLDPQGAYQWHTFYGSDSADYGHAIVVDENSDVYVSGNSDATWKGDGDVPPIHPRDGYAQDLFVLKLNTDGVYQWHTFYGGGSTDSGNSIEVAGQGGVLVAGETVGSWQGDGDTDPLHSAGIGNEIFALKLDTDGAYQWHTFYGNDVESSAQKAYAIDLDDDRNIYIGGESNGSWLGENGEQPLHPHSGEYDFTVLKLDAEGGYEWHTFYGASGSDSGFGIGVDADGNVYLAGQTTGTWLGDGDTAPIHAASGMMDLGVLKLDTHGAYLWHTFYGGTGNDTAWDIALDRWSNLYVAGISTDWLGDNLREPIHAYSGGFDQVVLSLNRDGAYNWHTFYGSASSDTALGIALDTLGSIYFTGESNQGWLGDGLSDPLHAHTGFRDLSVVKLDEHLVYLPILVR